MATKRVEIKIVGDVQGVGFRMFAAREAARLHLLGSAENLPDGSVSITAEGEETALIEFANLMKRGPSSASVERADIEWLSSANTFSGFTMT